MSPILTVRSVETIKPGRVRKEIPDRHLPGLYLLVHPSGARSWAVRYRVSGRSRKHTIGAFPAIDLKTARDLAGRALRAVAEGRDPGREKALARTAIPDTVEAIVMQFVELHCRRMNKPRTLATTQQLLDLHVLPRWRKRLVKTITRRDVINLLDGLVASGRPVAANRVLTAVRKLFNWAMERDILAVSPCAGVRAPTPEISRDRVLSDDELHAIWLAASRLGGPFGALIKLLMLTGQRRTEVARMSWSEVDLEARLWTLPKERTKNSRSHDVPLSEPVIAILQSLPRTGDFVLSVSGRTPVSNYGANKSRLDALLPADMPAWVLHDLRRSAASGMARLGVSLPAIEKVLGHVSGSFAGVVGIYQRHDFAGEKRRALELWGRHILALTRPPERSNVVEFETRG
jgi:integrase